MKIKYSFLFLGFVLILTAGCGARPILQTTSNQPVPEYAQTAGDDPDPETHGKGQYQDSDYHFKLAVPAGFKLNAALNGLSAYTKYFSTQMGEHPALGKEDVQLSVQIVHAQGKDGRPTSLAGLKKQIDKQKKEIAGLKITLTKDLSVDGLPAYQQLEDWTGVKNTDSGCVLKTYVEKDKEVHEISLFGFACAKVLEFRSDYDAAIESFRF